MATVRQTNFSAGELEPKLHGRTDLGIYGKGLRTCRNFFLSHAGAAVSRPGSTYVATVKATTAEGAPQFGTYYELTYGTPPARPVRLWRFVAGDGVSCVLEFGERYIRFHTRGAPIESVPGTPYEVVTAYLAHQLHLLRFAQVGDVLTITHPAQPAMELRRTGPADWSFTEVTYVPPDPVVPILGASAMSNPFDPVAPATLGSTTPFMLLRPLPVADADHPEREWIWGFTSIMRRRSDGQLLESRMEVVKYTTDGVQPVGPAVPDQVLLTSHKVALYPDMPVTLVRLVNGSIVPPDYDTTAFRIYRGRGDVFGWVGDTRTDEFIDVGDEPEWTIQPPIGTNPFRHTLTPSGQPALSLRPWTVAFFQERRIFGGAGVAISVDVGGPNPPTELFKQGATLFGSKAGDYFNHDVRVSPVHLVDEAFVKDIAIQTRQDIRHLVALDRLMVLTTAAARSVDGPNGSPLTYQPAHMPVVDEVGSTHVIPVEVDKSLLFVRAKGTGARALVPSQREGGYEGADITRIAEHLFVGPDRQLVDWCYAEDPWGLVWAVRADGTLLSLTYTRGGWGWARHDTDGLYESITAVPEGDEDAVYAVVKRLINGVEQRYIERFTSRHSRAPEIGDGAAVLSDDGLTVETPPDFICLDSAVKFLSDARPQAIGDLTHLEGEEVWIVGQGMMPVGPLHVAGGEIDVSDLELPFNVSCLAGNFILVYVGLK